MIKVMGIFIFLTCFILYSGISKAGSYLSGWQLSSESEIQDTIEYTVSLEKGIHGTSGVTPIEHGEWFFFYVTRVSKRSCRFQIDYFDPWNHHNIDGRWNHLIGFELKEGGSAGGSLNLGALGIGGSGGDSDRRERIFISRLFKYSIHLQEIHEGRRCDLVVKREKVSNFSDEYKRTVELNSDINKRCSVIDGDTYVRLYLGDRDKCRHHNDKADAGGETCWQLAAHPAYLDSMCYPSEYKYPVP